MLPPEWKRPGRVCPGLSRLLQASALFANRSFGCGNRGLAGGDLLARRRAFEAAVFHQDPEDQGQSDEARHDIKHALVRRFSLTVTSGPDAGKKFVSSGERTVVGTHESVDLVLLDETVSRFHCQIQPQAGQIEIRDLGSRNGTLVDGVSVVVGHLKPASRLTIGKSELRFDLDDERIELALSEKRRFGRMVGRSAVMRRAFERIARSVRPGVSSM